MRDPSEYALLWANGATFPEIVKAVRDEQAGYLRTQGTGIDLQIIEVDGLGGTAEYGEWSVWTEVPLDDDEGLETEVEEPVKEPSASDRLFERLAELDRQAEEFKLPDEADLDARLAAVEERARKAREDFEKVRGGRRGDV